MAVLLTAFIQDAEAAVSKTYVVGQLRLLFADWDANEDGFLDKEELARAFRGKDAKPYDHTPSAGKDRTGTKPKKEDYKKYPDYLFLVQLDENGDKKISRKEWEKWAKGYATDLKNYFQTQERLQKAQARFAAAKTASSRSKAQTYLQRYQQELLAMQKVQNAYQRQVIKALKAKSK
jgi:hypothetical protein